MNALENKPATYSALSEGAEHVHKFITTGTCTQQGDNVYVIYRCACGVEKLVYLAPSSAFD